MVRSSYKKCRKKRKRNEVCLSPPKKLHLINLFE
ncbi:hypothetical protein M7I_8291 [Glarea lozoyensis 74030]|uniref:Uncharacterized protein n=1 Tax=Glarea lozoyensis (strain ATCC 74030 / MF5533) TaxID=1104152 RepID=H0EZL5_GLAL7|nr:hypothetical protein M7I_8291 [Glarea lozoyensis 74030]